MLCKKCCRSFLKSLNFLRFVFAIKKKKRPHGVRVQCPPYNSRVAGLKPSSAKCFFFFVYLCWHMLSARWLQPANWRTPKLRSHPSISWRTPTQDTILALQEFAVAVWCSAWWSAAAQSRSWTTKKRRASLRTPVFSRFREPERTSAGKHGHSPWEGNANVLCESTGMSLTKTSVKCVRSTSSRVSVGIVCFRRTLAARFPQSFAHRPSLLLVATCVACLFRRTEW